MLVLAGALAHLSAMLGLQGMGMGHLWGFGHLAMGVKEKQLWQLAGTEGEAADSCRGRTGLRSQGREESWLHRGHPELPVPIKPAPRCPAVRAEGSRCC